MTIPVKLSYFKKQSSCQLRRILLPLFSSTFHESDKLYDREKKFERRQCRRRSKLGGLEMILPQKIFNWGSRKYYFPLFLLVIFIKLCEEKCSKSIFFWPISRKEGILFIPWWNWNRLKYLFDRRTLITIINSLLFSKLLYCSSVWANTTKKNIELLQTVQNFAARIVSGTRKFDHVTPILKQLPWVAANY